MNILSLGAGVQSTTVLLMSCLGVLPKLDCAVFADTQWEPKAVYEHLEQLESFALSHGVPVHRVTAGPLREHAIVSQIRGHKVDGVRWASMPLFTKAADGSVGMLRRQCTKEYKIDPIEKFIKRTLLGLKPRQRVPNGVVVNQWFGISADEASRMRGQYNNYWGRRVYPLCGVPRQLLDKPYRRSDCAAWLQANGFDVPPRSACIGCPFHTNAEWREISKRPAEWADAVEFDRLIRKSGGMRGDVFLHRSGVPLAEVALDNGAQPSLWTQECCGVCAV